MQEQENVLDVYGKIEGLITFDLFGIKKLSSVLRIFSKEN